LDLQTQSFRWGVEHLGESNPIWEELQQLLGSITQEKVERLKLRYFQDWTGGSSRKSPPVGGQSILNELIDDMLGRAGWETQLYVLGEVFDESNGRNRKLNYWSMDFKKRDIGVEVSFNNAGVLAQNILRLSVMSETVTRPRSELIRLGILVTATQRLKEWAGMDGTVLTFESVNKVLPLVTFNIPTPIVVLGLDAADGEAWAQRGFFEHKKLPAFSSLNPSQQSQWLYQIDEFVNLLGE
jgi:hypothetical protein